MKMSTTCIPYAVKIVMVVVVVVVVVECYCFLIIIIVVACGPRRLVKNDTFVD